MASPVIERIEKSSKRLKVFNSQVEKEKKKEKNYKKDLQYFENIFNFLNSFNKTLNEILIPNAWFAEEDKIDNTLKRTENLVRKISFSQAYIYDSIPEISRKEDVSIAFGLCLERMKKLIDRLKCVKDKAVSSELFKTLSWEDKIKSFSILPKDWDGQGSLTVPKSRITAAIKFLKLHNKHEDSLKMVYPSMIGSVGMIYKLKNIQITLVFLSKDKVELSVINEEYDILIHEQLVVNDIESLDKFVLTNDKQK